MDKIKNWIKQNKIIAGVIGFFIISCFLCVILALILMAFGYDPESNDKKTTNKQAVTTNKNTTTTNKKSTTTSDTTTTILKTTTTKKQVTDNKKVQDAIGKLLGKSNRDIDTKKVKVLGPDNGADITITWAIDDNLTDGLLKDGARIDATDILEELAKTKVEYTTVTLVGTFLLVDKLGNTSEENVLIATYDKELVNQINFENFYFKDVLELDPSVFIHPTFQY